MAKRKSKKTSNGMFATACVLLAVIVVVIIFLIKKDQILTNYKQTAFFDRVFGSTPEFVEKHEEKPKSASDDTIILELKDDKPELQKKIEDEIQKQTEKVENKIEEIAKDKIAEKVEETVKKTENKTEKKTEKETPAPAAKATTEYQLCFIKIDADGSVIRKIVKRTETKSDSPLTSAINLIIKGPNTTLAAEKDCQSFIPKGSKLLSARVSDGVAYLNFNDLFEFNEMGVEGSRAQLMQIVYTATSFNTVNSVQILIEGQKRDYLGSEGEFQQMWIGSPLSRSSF